jgi:putative ABC transport system ATP-binding protein
MNQPIFGLRDVAKYFRKGKQTITIFDALSLTIGEGEFVSLMGPSGSGKTTLLNLLGGMDRASAGVLEFKGQRLDRMSETALSRWRRRNVGFVFQSYNLMPTLTAAQNVELPLLLTGLNGRERKRNVATALELVGLSERARHKPRELSGGQQQRVAVARALIADPEVILADEPTGDLDRENATEIMKLFATLNASMGKTIVLVTHDPEAAFFSKRTLQMNKGELIVQQDKAA